ncbi:TOBE domain-containing protein [Bradyrhizobium sp. ISRA435]|nr:TOBE domain-containing protein [Bradyrhizobium sp. ISRA435]
MIMVTHDQLDALAIADRIAVLHKGVLQQLGRPEELYLNPANSFVAGFIGQLRMNLLPCRHRNGALEGDGFSLPARPDAIEALSAQSGEITVGFRPEAVTVHRRAVADACLAKVETTQFQGERAISVLRLGGTPIHVSLDSRVRLEVGRSVWLAVPPDQLHVFGPDGERISGPAAAAKPEAAVAG